MLASLLLSGFLALNPFRPAPPVPFVASAAVPLGSIDPCLIYGSIYLETDPYRRSYCFATVYLEPEEAFADLLVYQEDNKLFADKAGFWYQTPTRDFADYVLFVTDKRALADFYIHYTKSRSFAGCRKQ
ncbi:DUF6150 family protein [Hymenobacter chitinivorans]|uniref:7(1) septoil knot domain-containing protein n=1 Tax=Hymenobacter chitinivorans DSM 11115 TaxID=1121954 RepID=A0A2M9ASY6_9BACT|nr:DUF6150 family protein [Hymenobacter chitinivorans]PJJ48792.1 hypothetical protein CLV45_4502 [Hymenobacter chitinivorans DSM 11115]